MIEQLVFYSLFWHLKLIKNSSQKYEHTSVRAKNNPNPPAALKPLSILSSRKSLQGWQSLGTSLFLRLPSGVIFAGAAVGVPDVVVIGSNEHVEICFVQKACSVLFKFD